jgi:formylglycine-generating enzyme required for sulfatase activity
LQHAHEKGLVHRDIKPGNLMVARSGPAEPPVVKVLDFGLARFESESTQATRLTQLGKIVGTVDYIAPEQANDARTADIRADIYSLGCSLFYLLTGEPPFPGHIPIQKIGARMLGDAPPVRDRRPEVSPALERVLAKMMARNPPDRYQTPGEAAQALGPHTRDERPTLNTALIPGRSVAHTPGPPAVAEAPAHAFTPPGTEFASLQPDGERKPRRRVIASFWVALAGVVALLGVLLGVVVLVANMGAGDSKKGQALAPGDARVDKTKRAVPGDKALQRKDIVPNDDAGRHGEPEIENSIHMKLVLIPAGRFMMGSPPDEKDRVGNEGPRHTVEISRPFYMGVYPVTQEEYQKVMGNNPSYFSPRGGGKDKVIGQDTRRFPVEQVSWHEAIAFCEKLSALEREKRAGRVYRLPTEAEWEYACRAGTATPFHFGWELNGKQANCNGTVPYGTDEKGPYLGRTTAVGSYPKNAFGLCDMHGNVYQWCNDWHDEGYFNRSPEKDPPGPPSGPYGERSLRGGAWADKAWNARAACRSRGLPDTRGAAGLGFRVVCVMRGIP